MEENTGNNKKRIISIVAVIIAILAVIAGGLWYAVHNGYITISKNPFGGSTKETAKELTVASNDTTKNTTKAKTEPTSELESESKEEKSSNVEEISEENSVAESTEKTDENNSDNTLSSDDESRKAESIKAAQAEREASQKFEPINDVVTAKIKTNLRSTPEQENDDNVVASIEYGEQVNRTAVSINGWSQIDYDGETLYAVSSFLMDPEESLAASNKPTEATQKQLDFATVDEMVTAKIETNLRKVPSTKNDEDIVVMIKNGETVRRTGIATNGWSRVEYEGQTLYAVSSLLTLVED